MWSRPVHVIINGADACARQSQAELFTQVDDQRVAYYPDIARLLVIGRQAILDCWPAEDFVLKPENANTHTVLGTKSNRSILNGSLARLATGELVQISMGAYDSRGHRVLKFQGARDASIHDIMQDPWSHGQAASADVVQLVTQAVRAGRLRSITVQKVATILHKIEQAKYWSSLKKTHDDPTLPKRGKHAVQEQMTACLKSMQAPPSWELVSIVQAGCEEEEPGEVSEGRKALRAFLHNKRPRHAAAQSNKPLPNLNQPGNANSAVKDKSDAAVNGLKDKSDAAVSGLKDKSDAVAGASKDKSNAAVSGLRATSSAEADVAKHNTSGAKANGHAASASTHLAVPGDSHTTAMQSGVQDSSKRARVGAQEQVACSSGDANLTNTHVSGSTQPEQAMQPAAAKMTQQFYELPEQAQSELVEKLGRFRKSLEDYGQLWSSERNSQATYEQQVAQRLVPKPNMPAATQHTATAVVPRHEFGLMPRAGAMGSSDNIITSATIAKLASTGQLPKQLPKQMPPFSQAPSMPVPMGKANGQLPSTGKRKHPEQDSAQSAPQHFTGSRTPQSPSSNPSPVSSNLIPPSSNLSSPSSNLSSPSSKLSSPKSNPSPSSSQKTSPSSGRKQPIMWNPTLANSRPTSAAAQAVNPTAVAVQAATCCPAITGGVKLRSTGHSFRSPATNYTSVQFSFPPPLSASAVTSAVTPSASALTSAVMQPASVAKTAVESGSQGNSKANVSTVQPAQRRGRRSIIWNVPNPQTPSVSSQISASQATPNAVGASELKSPRNADGASTAKSAPGTAQKPIPGSVQGTILKPSSQPQPEAGSGSGAASSAKADSSAANSQKGTQQPGRGDSKGLQQQPGRDGRQPDQAKKPESDGDDDNGGGARQSAEQKQQNCSTAFRFDLKWSWGSSDSPVTGLFKVSLVDVMLQEMYKADSDAARLIAHSANHPSEPQWFTHLADPSTFDDNVTCFGVLAVHCAGTPAMVSSRHQSGHNPEFCLDFDRALKLADCSLSSLQGVLEHDRLWACLNQSGMALCAPFPDSDLDSEETVKPNAEQALQHSLSMPHGKHLEADDRGEKPRGSGKKPTLEAPGKALFHTIKDKAAAEEPSKALLQSSMDNTASAAGKAMPGVLPGSSTSNMPARLSTQADLADATLPQARHVRSGQDQEKSATGAKPQNAKQEKSVVAEAARSEDSGDKNYRWVLVAGTHLKLWMSKFCKVHELGQAVEELGKEADKALFCLLVMQKPGQRLPTLPQLASAVPPSALSHHVADGNATQGPSQQAAPSAAVTAAKAAKSPAAAAAAAERAVPVSTETNVVDAAAAQQASKDSSGVSDGVVHIAGRQQQAKSARKVQQAPQGQSTQAASGAEEAGSASKHLAKHLSGTEPIESQQAAGSAHGHQSEALHDQAQKFMRELSAEAAVRIDAKAESAAQAKEKAPQSTELPVPSRQAHRAAKTLPAAEADAKVSGQDSQNMPPASSSAQLQERGREVAMGEAKGQGFLDQVSGFPGTDDKLQQSSESKSDHAARMLAPSGSEVSATPKDNSHSTQLEPTSTSVAAFTPAQHRADVLSADPQQPSQDRVADKQRSHAHSSRPEVHDTNLAAGASRQAITSTDQADAKSTAHQTVHSAFEAERSLLPVKAEESRPADKAEATLPASTKAPAASAKGSGLTQSKTKQKRQYRQPSAEEHNSPEAKRAKGNSGQPHQAIGASKPPEQQPAAKSSDDTKAHSKPREPVQHAEKPRTKYHTPVPKPQMQSTDLPPDTLDKIFRSMRRLQLVGHGLHGKEVLSQRHLGRVQQLSPLVQLRIMSKYATEVMPHGNVVKFFQGVVSNVARKAEETRWLAEREEIFGKFTFGDGASSLLDRLEDCRMLWDRDMPRKSAQLLPVQLQAAYILCLGGHYDSQTLWEFAHDLLRSILAQILLFMEKHPTAPTHFDTSKENLKLAGGSPDQVLNCAAREDHSASRAAHQVVKPRLPTPPTVAELDMEEITMFVMAGLNYTDRLNSRLDDLSTGFLRQLEPIWQLRVLSIFVQNLLPSSPNASAYLTSLVKHNRTDMRNKKYAWLKSSGKKGAQTGIGYKAQNLLTSAVNASLLPRYVVDTALVAALPPDMHCAAICYAVGRGGTGPKLSNAIESFVAFFWDQVCKVNPEADPTHDSQVANKSRPQSAHQVTQHDHSHQTGLRDNSRQSSPTEFDHSKQIPQGPVDPRGQPPSNPSHPHPPPSNHQQPHQGQSHGVRRPRHCQYFFGEGGCRHSNCPFYHGSHPEYVEAMAQEGLVPYGLKFAKTTGRDKWIVDRAVDALNKLMIEGQLPRFSFRDGDLRPLAFLEEPNGEHSKLQLQAVQAMAERGPTYNAVQLLQDVCNQIQAAQQGFAGRQEGYAGAAEGYSRGGSAPPLPDLPPLPMEMTEGPFVSAPMFAPQPDFSPSPVGPSPLPLSLPFSLEPPPPLPNEDPDGGDIPFPLLLYEEVLLAGLLQLHQITGAVESVDQLLAMQPQCAMPPEIARHFSGDMREKVLSLLHSRPWLFVVTPHGISVTGLAREGLVYKRDVITHLYTALTNGSASVTVAEVAEQVSQPLGIRQVIMESNNGLAELLQSPLFKEDVMVHFQGPFGVCVELRMSGT